ncbi:hypothetical protein [uncultured Mesotoga sp.]|uniref:hypothetical protein n=1 Tax=uncultured Mesotoga sp. TaxID=1184400 RepID=UPI0025932E70|nr:hypothetical protein [uncultured Mesotoga sp.]
MLITDAGDGYVYVEFPASELIGKQKAGEFISYYDGGGLKTLRRLLHAEEVDSFVKRRCPTLSEAVSSDKIFRKVKSSLKKRTADS